MAPALFTPLALGPIEVPNRIAVSPMCQYSANDGVASDWHVQHLMTFAMSGAGLVALEATGVERSGRISLRCLGLYSDACEYALGRVLAAARSVALPGTKFALQLAHAGRKGSVHVAWERGKPLTAAEGAWQTLAPSAIPVGEGSPVPEALDEAGIERIIAAFADATRRAVRIGFDAIEMHAAHGYLVHEFHSPISNRRTDAWGGDEERRLHFPCAVADAMRAVTPKHIALGARITGTDFIDGGLTVDDAIVLAGRLEDRGFDYVCVSSGNIVTGGRPVSEPGFNVANAARVKAATRMAVRTTGFIVTPAQAEDIVAQGGVDQVAIARAFLDDPRWGWHAAEQLGAKISLPPQYARAAPAAWPGAEMARDSASRAER
ncbi:MAG TPA: NADH:flavin oxidoreductase/NADH oxidase [Beijerinckiaceae bacterium]|jgi:2,4-dienoyl-CoA reductase-like NADH-dependent reductase (Old Yellow Enzyme family)|nr:NADH:flavin oxidoreductase/NADH oxidase [Beijerinckiaceae bacterium]